jgi:hypothetical protein
MTAKCNEVFSDGWPHRNRMKLQRIRDSVPIQLTYFTYIRPTYVTFHITACRRRQILTLIIELYCTCLNRFHAYSQILI